MKSKLSTPSNRKSEPPAKRWIRFDLRVFVLQALRGAAYATGTTVVTTLAWWMQHR